VAAKGRWRIQGFPKEVWLVSSGLLGGELPPGCQKLAPSVAAANLNAWFLAGSFQESSLAILRAICKPSSQFSNLSKDLLLSLLIAHVKEQVLSGALVAVTCKIGHSPWPGPEAIADQLRKEFFRAMEHQRVVGDAPHQRDQIIWRTVTELIRPTLDGGVEIIVPRESASERVLLAGEALAAFVYDEAKSVVIGELAEEVLATSGARLGKVALKQGLKRTTTVLWGIAMYSAEILKAVDVALLVFDPLVLGHTEEDIQKSALKEFVRTYDSLRPPPAKKPLDPSILMEEALPKQDAVKVVLPQRKWMR
jgi:hypothetical protein